MSFPLPTPSPGHTLALKQKSLIGLEDSHILWGEHLAPASSPFSSNEKLSGHRYGGSSWGDGGEGPGALSSSVNLLMLRLTFLIQLQSGHSNPPLLLCPNPPLLSCHLVRHTKFRTGPMLSSSINLIQVQASTSSHCLDKSGLTF